MARASTANDANRAASAHGGDQGARDQSGDRSSAPTSAGAASSPPATATVNMRPREVGKKRWKTRRDWSGDQLGEPYGPSATRRAPEPSAFATHRPTAFELLCAT